jgi:DNA-binding HxlR family transcriptional regulator
MEWLDYDSDLCPVQRTLALIGEKWTILIVRDAVNGIRRFEDFRRHVGLSEGVLADRLRTLVAAGIMTTREYQEPGQRRRHEYRLTAKGWDLYPVLIALMQWGNAHLPDDEGPTYRVEHIACGQPVRAEVRCTHDGPHDGRALQPRDTRLVVGADPNSPDPNRALTLT